MREGCEAYRERVLLEIYGEGKADGSHASTCSRCGGIRDDWEGVLEAYRADPAPAPAFRRPPASLLGEVRRRPALAMSALSAAALVLIFGAATVEATRVEPAFALADGEIYWTLRSLHRQADRVRDSGQGPASRPPREGLAREIQETDDEINRVRREMEEW